MAILGSPQLRDTNSCKKIAKLWNGLLYIQYISLLCPNFLYYVQRKKQLNNTICGKVHGGEHLCTFNLNLSSDFASYETYPFQSLSVEAYHFNDDLYEVFAQPNTGICAVYIWDHVNMLFRAHYNITCKSSFFVIFFVIHDICFVMFSRISD